MEAQPDEVACKQLHEQDMPAATKALEKAESKRKSAANALKEVMNSHSIRPERLLTHRNRLKAMSKLSSAR